MSKILTPVAYSIITALLCLGLWALYEATTRERAAEAAHAQHVAHCEQVKALMLAEFDAIVGAGKFPTQVQQDYWVGLTAGCEEAE